MSHVWFFFCLKWQSSYGHVRTNLTALVVNLERSVTTPQSPMPPPVTELLHNSLGINIFNSVALFLAMIRIQLSLLIVQLVPCKWLRLIFIWHRVVAVLKEGRVMIFIKKNRNLCSTQKHPLFIYFLYCLYYLFI